MDLNLDNKGFISNAPLMILLDSITLLFNLNIANYNYVNNYQ